MILRAFVLVVDVVVVTRCRCLEGEPATSSTPFILKRLSSKKSCLFALWRGVFCVCVCVCDLHSDRL